MEMETSNTFHSLKENVFPFFILLYKIVNNFRERVRFAKLSILLANIKTLRIGDWTSLCARITPGGICGSRIRASNSL